MRDTHLTRLRQVRYRKPKDGPVPLDAYWGHPETWWRWMRRSLDQLGIDKLTAEQHALAEHFVSDIQVKPITAALKVAALTHDIETEWTNGRMTVLRSERRSA